MAAPDELRPFLAGEKLYGDDFDRAAIEAWYEDEKEGYAGLVEARQREYRYSYHRLNAICGFRHLRRDRYESALGFGSAYGDEFLPIRDRVASVTIVEPSESLVRELPLDVPVRRFRPDPSGTLPIPDGAHDLVLCLSVLHHVPNVTHVLGELHRVLRPGGEALVREPIVSMGDWRRPRPGLTRRERGIPLDMFRKRLEEGGWEIRRETLCVFPGVTRLCERLGIAAFDRDVLTHVDLAFCRLLRPNLRYHAEHWLHRLRPTAVFYVLARPE